MKSIVSRVVRGVILFVSALVPLSAQAIYYLPQVANGSAGGLQVSTTFVVLNHGTVPGTVAITLRDDSGSALTMNLPSLGLGSDFAFPLAPGETRLLQSDGAGDLQIGAARATVTGDISVAAVFSIRRESGELLTEAGVGAAVGLTRFVVAVDAQPPFNTGVALQNPSSGTAVTLTLTLSDQSGNQEGEPAKLELAAGGHRAIYVAGQGGAFPQLGSFRGRLLIEATAPVAALTLRQNVANAGPLTTLPVVPSDSNRTSFSLPQVAQGGGVKTQFVLFGLDNTAANITITTTDDQGLPLSVELSNGTSGSHFDLRIPASGALFLETKATGELMTGAARVVSDKPIGMSAIFSLVNAQGVITTEAGLGDSRSYTRFTVPVDLTSGFNTGVALFNDSGATSNVTINFLPERGTAQAASVAPKTFTLLPLQHVAKFVSELFDGLGDSIGQMAVQTTSQLSAITLRQGAVSLTTLPVAEGIAVTGGGGSEDAGLIHKVVEGVDLTSDTILDQVLERGVRLFGRIEAPEGFRIIGVSAVILQRLSELDTFLGNVDLAGNYEITVRAGNHDIHISLEPVADEPGRIISIDHLESNVSIHSNTERNFVVPPLELRSVTGRLTGLNSLPADVIDFPGFNVDVRLDFVSETTLTRGTVGADEGSYSLQLPNGTYEVRLSFGQGTLTRPISSAELAEIGRVSVSGATVADFTVPPLAFVSGTVTLAQPIALQYGQHLVFADDVVSHQRLVGGLLGGSASAGLIEEDGSYSVTVRRGREYAFMAAIDVIARTGANGAWGTPLPGTSVQTFNGDGVVNFEYPPFPALRKLSGRITNQEGEPLQGARVAVTGGEVTGAPNTIFNTSGPTDSNGEYSINVFQGVNYRVLFFPPIQ